jgi:hypothetical protein
MLSAYLTHWHPGRSLGTQCQEFLFIVGTDFGLTRKDACRAVLKWLPAQFKCNFLAVDQVAGFHPKVLFWKEQNGSCHLVLGSSNITQAAFATNYEANVRTRISKKQYAALRTWLQQVEDASSPIPAAG